jgi:hypothetical protein
MNYTIRYYQVFFFFKMTTPCQYYRISKIRSDRLNDCIDRDSEDLQFCEYNDPHVETVQLQIQWLLMYFLFSIYKHSPQYSATPFFYTIQIQRNYRHLT